MVLLTQGLIVEIQWLTIEISKGILFGIIIVLLLHLPLIRH